MIGLGLRTQLVQRAELRQVLTPQQRQLVDVLELPDATLDGYLRELLASNPALQRRPDASFVRELRSEAPKGRAASGGDDELPPMEARVTEEGDLMAHLLEQFRLERSTDDEFRAALVILGNLDGYGLLTMPPEEVADRAGVALHDVQSAQMIVMGLDPLGCGADDLAHYLRAMVQLQYPEDPFFPDIVGEHLDELRRKRFDRVAQALDLDVEDVEEYHRMLVEEVDPFPARGFAHAEAPGAAVGQTLGEHVRPTMDLIEDEEAEGGFKIEMHDDPRAPVRINPKFEREVAAMPDGPEKKEAMERLEQARVVIRSLEERHSLVKQIAELAVRGQRTFLHSGDKATLVNLTMAEVAEQLRRDTSTVSRAVAGRYVQWGAQTLALRDLFVNRGGGQDTSADALKAAIEEIVAQEDKRRPLSDAAIAKQLSARGMDGVARRTIAKYRGLLFIPSSRDRKAR